MDTIKKGQILGNLLLAYLANDICMAELLADEKVPEGTTFEEAFKIYIEMMKRIEGDKFFTIKEGEKMEL